MQRAAPAALLLALVLAACGGGRDRPMRDPGPAVAPATAAASGGFAADLRRGGHVIALRHAATDFSMADEARDYADCAHQRNLSAPGRRQARAIGRAFGALRVPV